MKIALIGNQNSGKTSLFNALTGMNQKIGNWPGVTIEKKEGTIKGTKHKLIDLPGIYSLSPYSIEENISKDFIFKENPDIIINVVDSTNLERNLYLTTQVLETSCKVIIALNMSDLLEEKGIQIDEQKLSKYLKTPVYKVSALTKEGIDDLITEINQKIKPKQPQSIFDEKIEKAITEVETSLKDNHKRFTSIKILENDYRFKNEKYTKIRKKLEKNYDTDLEEIIATERYDYIEKIRKDVLKRTKKKESISDKLDKIFLNKYLSFPIFIIIMFLIYFLSVGVVGTYTVDLIGSIMDNFTNFINQFLVTHNVSGWLVSLVCDGIIAGVGAVLSFVPQLIILFLCISILETTGYMSRISLMLDKFFRKIGLSGKALIPFIVGSGCSVPGIMGTRIIENADEREMTSILTPFIPCSAKLPIIALFSGSFFGKNSGLVSASLYFLAIIVIIISALIMKKFIYKTSSSTFIYELPEYRLPSLKYTLRDVYDKVISFIKRAGTVILMCSIVIWFLLSFSFKLEYGVAIEDSILAVIGNKISFIFYPILGVNSWGATISAIQGLVAKEQVISSMSIIAGFTEEVGGTELFNSSIFSFFTPVSAYAFMVFNLFSAPCFGAIGAMKRELGSNKKLLIAIFFQTFMAWLLSALINIIGTIIISI